MRIAVLSDIHGNGYALNKVLADLNHQNIDGHIFLGDSITDGPDIDAIIDTTRNLGMVVLNGNREEYILEYEENNEEWKDSLQFRGYLNTYQHTSKRNLAYLKNNQISESLTIGEKKLRLFHGVPNKTRKVFVPSRDEAEVILWTRETPADIYLGGHTHIAYQHHHKSQDGDCWFFNPGSVGLPLRSNGFNYGIIEISKDEIHWEQRTVPYDIADLIADTNHRHPDYRKQAGIWSELYFLSLQNNRDEGFDFFRLAYQLAGIETAIGETKPISNEVFLIAEQVWRTKNAR